MTQNKVFMTLKHLADKFGLDWLRDSEPKTYNEVLTDLGMTDDTVLIPVTPTEHQILTNCAGVLQILAIAECDEKMQELAEKAQEILEKAKWEQST